MSIESREMMVSTDDNLTLWSQAYGKPGSHPLLLIMGAMNQGIFWPDNFCRRLADLNCYVIRYDHRDTGHSSTVDYQQRPYRLAELADDARAVLRGHGVARASVIGLSMGGYIAQLLAIEHPETVQRLVLISTTADQRPYMAATTGQPQAGLTLPGLGQALLDYIQATVARPPRSPAETLDNLLTGWALTYGGRRAFPVAQITKALNLAATRTNNPQAAMHHAFAVAASPDRLAGVRTISLPTLVIHGRDDICLPLPHGEYLAANIPRARLQVLDMGHSFMWSADEEVFSAIKGFFLE